MTMTKYENRSFDEERALYGAKNILVNGCRFDGPAESEYFMMRSERLDFDSVKIKGEYLAWYCENVTFENCTIIGTQPLCCCRGLKLVNCRMVDTDLCFEKSEVDASIVTAVDSIKNTRAGRITVPALGELIMDDPEAKGEVVVAAGPGNQKLRLRRQQCRQ